MTENYVNDKNSDQPNRTHSPTLNEDGSFSPSWEDVRSRPDNISSNHEHEYAHQESSRKLPIAMIAVSVGGFLLSSAEIGIAARMADKTGLTSDVVLEWTCGLVGMSASSYLYFKNVSELGRSAK